MSTYIAKQALVVGYDDDGAEVIRQPGETIPEADNWTHTAIDSLLRVGRIADADADASDVLSLVRRVTRIEAHLELLSIDEDSMEQVESPPAATIVEDRKEDEEAYDDEDEDSQEEEQNEDINDDASTAPRRRKKVITS